MKKLFLIPLMSLLTCVMAWGEGHATQQPEDVAEMKVVNGNDISVTYFATLQDAVDALPQNSYPATVKVLKNTVSSYTSQALTINQFQNVTLDLNGCEVYCNANNTKGSSLIDNKGTLTIEDSSDGKTGLLSNSANNPDASAEHGAVPGYATNVIINCGRLYVNGGTIECTVTTEGASYCIDMYEKWANYAQTPANYVEINGGTLINDANPCIRVCGYNGANQTLVINDGLLKSQRRTIWAQQQTKRQNKYATQQVSITINGGTLETGPGYTYSSRNFAIMAESDDNNDWSALTINVNGGTIKGDIAVDASDTWTGTWNGINGDINKLAKVNITGGNFEINPNPDGTHVGGFFYRMCNRKGIDCTIKGITGGTFASDPNAVLTVVSTYGNGGGESSAETNTEMKAWGYYIADGYCAHDNGNGTWTVKPCNSATYTTSETVAADVDYSTTDVTVESNVTVTIPEDKTMEVHSLAGEGQIVVKDGATLVIGNGGLKSENDDLTQVIVEAGGTIAIGNGGITKQGEATPIEIQSDGNKSGVLLIDPNAPAAVAQAPAKVKVYTRAHKDNGIEYWQQFASPVKGNMTITPLGVGQEDGVYTSIYGWDYSADEWVRVPGMPVDLGSGVTAFGKTGWSGNNILAPFAAYNLINNSLLSEGGITYEFAGELVGNDDMVLTFPANGFCVFGNSYTAPIDLTTLFDQIQNDMDLDNIDAVVYIYNSVKDRFDAVNALTLELDAMGFADAPFTQIPPQQAFVMNLLAGGSAQTAVDYAKSVWGNQQANKNTPIMAPKRVNNTISAALNIQVTDGEATDRVVLVEDSKYSEGYDRGADAEKYMNANFNIYANAAGRDLAMVATDDMEGTELTFAAGNAVNYTMTFANVEGEYVLVDNLNNNQIAIAEGGTYTFAAQPKSTVTGRFAIVPMAKMPTAIENTEVKANVKGIYSITGMYLGEDFKALPAGVYVVDGVKIVK